MTHAIMLRFAKDRVLEAARKDVEGRAEKWVGWLAPLGLATRELLALEAVSCPACEGTGYIRKGPGRSKRVCPAHCENGRRPGGKS